MGVVRMIVEQYAPDITTSVQALPLGGILLRSNIPHTVSTDGAEVTFALDGIRTDLSIVLEVPLGDAVSYWHPYGHWGRTTLPPDWRGSEQTSLVRSAPIGCLYAHDGSTLLGFALDDTEARTLVRFGVSEETKGFVVCIDVEANDLPRALRLRLTAGDSPATTSIDELSRWQRLTRGVDMLPPSPVATEPVYSTWYAYHHEVDAQTLIADAPAAVELGFGSLFLDFGWQRHGAGRQFEGCGDWTPDESKFADLAGFVHTMHNEGLAVIAWVAPFLLGELSDRFAERSHLAPHHHETLNTRILDPRHREVREDIVRQFTELVQTNDLDGLKIDFVDTVSIYEGTPSPGDIAEIPDAVRTMFDQLRNALADIGKGDILIEFRQPYVATDMMAFGNVMRAEDCPGDPVLNRTSIIDARLGGWDVVHSDMMMWHPSVTPEQLIRHLHSSLLGVPQLSVPVRELDEAHAIVIRQWLSVWRELSSITLAGTPDCSLHDHAPVVTVVAPDMLRAVVVAYEPHRVIEVPDVAEVVLVNATASRSICLRLEPGVVYDLVTTDIRGVVAPAVTRSVDENSAIFVDVPESGYLAIHRAA
jgi:alpha-galactosidase